MATCFGGASLAAADDREAPCARLVPVVPFFVRALSVSAVVFVIPLLMARVGRRPASVVSRSVPGRTGADAAAVGRCAKRRGCVQSHGLTPASSHATGMTAVETCGRPWRAGRRPALRAGSVSRFSPGADTVTAAHGAGDNRHGPVTPVDAWGGEECFGRR